MPTAGPVERTPIRTPEIPYVTALVAIMAVSSNTFAAMMMEQSGRLRRHPFVRTYVGVMASTALVGLITLDHVGALRPPLGTLDVGRSALAVVIAVSAGIACFVAERALRRQLLGRRRHRSARRAPPTAGLGQRDLESSLEPTGLGWLVTVACLEEVLFRLLAVDLALMLPSWPARAAALIGLSTCFAIGHDRPGSSEAFIKLPLAAVLLALTLVSGSIGPAIAAHVTFNACVWRGSRRLTTYAW